MRRRWRAWLASLDAVGADNPDNNESHAEDRCDDCDVARDLHPCIEHRVHVLINRLCTRLGGN